MANACGFIRGRRRQNRQPDGTVTMSPTNSETGRLSIRPAETSITNIARAASRTSRHFGRRVSGPVVRRRRAAGPLARLRGSLEMHRRLTDGSVRRGLPSERRPLRSTRARSSTSVPWTRNARASPPFRLPPSRAIGPRNRAPPASSRRTLAEGSSRLSPPRRSSSFTQGARDDVGLAARQSARPRAPRAVFGPLRTWRSTITSRSASRPAARGGTRTAAARLRTAIKPRSYIGRSCSTAAPRSRR